MRSTKAWENRQIPCKSYKEINKQRQRKAGQPDPHFFPLPATCGGGAMVEETEREIERQRQRQRNGERERVRRQTFLGLEVGLEYNK